MPSGPHIIHNKWWNYSRQQSRRIQKEAMCPNVRYYLGNYLDVWRKATTPEWPLSGPSNILLLWSQVK